MLCFHLSDLPSYSLQFLLKPKKNHPILFSLFSLFALFSKSSDFPIPHISLYETNRRALPDLILSNPSSTVQEPHQSIEPLLRRGGLQGDRCHRVIPALTVPSQMTGSELDRENTSFHPLHLASPQHRSLCLSLSLSLTHIHILISLARGTHIAPLPPLSFTLLSALMQC